MKSENQHNKPLRVLACCSFPIEAAATRFRVGQFLDPLEKCGIKLELSTFLNSYQFQRFYRSGATWKKIVGLIGSVLRRIVEIGSIGKYDLLFVQREATIIGPAVFEWIYQRIGRVPMVLDLDDATYVRYISPSYGRLGNVFKFFGKTDRLIDRSDMVICGNRFIAEYVENRGVRTVVIPTIVDTDVFKPSETQNAIPIIGWIGTHSTFPFLERLFPVLNDLRKSHEFKVRIVGSGRRELSTEGLEVENLEWSLHREVEDFQSLDIGLYPMDTSGSLDPSWLAGKSGFKAIQYMAVGLPFVMSPVGVCAEMGEAGKTHFNAESPEDWYNSLDRLLSNCKLRLDMGAAGRSHALEYYGLRKHTIMLADALNSIELSRTRQ